MYRAKGGAGGGGEGNGSGGMPASLLQCLVPMQANHQPEMLVHSITLGITHSMHIINTLSLQMYNTGFGKQDEGGCGWGKGGRC